MNAPTPAPVVEARLIITNPVGLHARPAALFVRAAAAFQATITLRNLTREALNPGSVIKADAKSLLGLLTLGVARGHEVLISAQGPDAVEAVARLRALLDAPAEPA